MNLTELDQQLLWHPFTQHQTMGLPLAIASAKGNYVYDYAGNSYLDLISSWWVNLHGHAHPAIAKAIYKQALRLEHVIFAGFTHAPAVQLCEMIVKELSNNLTRGFFSDNGSTSVEVAMKIAYQYWYNRKQSARKLFLSFSGGYHGDTFGAMSIGQKSGFHNVFTKLCFEVLFVPFPDLHTDNDTVELREQQALKVAEEHLSKHQYSIAAIIIEPLIQGAAGMKICRHSFIEQLIGLIRSKGILVIFDEVMTGFGRTGTTFAVQQLKVEPDLLCLSKGITGGFLPLGLTLATEEIYQTFLGSDLQVAFMHGHSYTANPLACAAGVKSWQLLQQSKTQQAIKIIETTHRQGIKILQENTNNCSNFRILGTIMAFEVNTTDPNFNQKFKQECLLQGILLRPLNNTIYLMPPYSVTAVELLSAYHKIAKIIELLR